MSLVAGTRLGPYEIISAIGAGAPPAFASCIPDANYGEISPKPSRRTR